MKINEEYIPYNEFNWKKTPYKIYTETIFEADDIINIQLKESENSNWIYQLGFHFKKPSNNLIISIPLNLPAIGRIENQFIYITYHSILKDRDDKLTQILNP